MAQILSFPKANVVPPRFTAEVSQAPRQCPEQAEALAVFDRLMAFHEETQRQMADFLQHSDEATVDAPHTDIVYLMAREA